ARGEGGLRRPDGEAHRGGAADARGGRRGDEDLSRNSLPRRGRRGKIGGQPPRAGCGSGADRGSRARDRRVPRRQGGEAVPGGRRAARVGPADRRQEPEGPAAEPAGGIHQGDAMSRNLRDALIIGIVLGAASRAGAQQIEVPVLVLEGPEAESGEVDTELNLANLVQSAAKGVTTVQEAPAIITIIPGDDLLDRNTR